MTIVLGNITARPLHLSNVNDIQKVEMPVVVMAPSAVSCLAIRLTRSREKAVIHMSFTCQYSDAAERYLAEVLTNAWITLSNGEHNCRRRKRPNLC